MTCPVQYLVNLVYLNLYIHCKKQIYSIYLIFYSNLLNFYLKYRALYRNELSGTIVTTFGNLKSLVRL